MLDSASDIANTGTVTTGRDLGVHAASINNRGALLNAAGTLSVSTATLDNRNTAGAAQGIQAGRVTIDATVIDNTLGTIAADTTLAITGSDNLDNTQGLIAAGGTLTLADANPSAKTLAIANAQGTLLAGQNLQVDAVSMSGDGSLLSQGDLGIELVDDFVHRGELSANGNATFETAGRLTNQAAMRAGNALGVSAANIDNTVSGEFNATATTLTATARLTNRGLIDGSDTFITAATLDNLGAGAHLWRPSGHRRQHA